MTEIQFTNVSKTFTRIDTKGILHAVQDVSFAARSGEFIAIVGKSGCGKSTMLRMIAGLIKPTSGSIKIDGKEVNSTNPDIGYMFQDSLLFPWLTVRGNIEFSFRMRKEKEKAKERVDKLIKMIGLEGFENAYPLSLSGGMKSRVALARTLAYSPKILLLDEPLSALDVFTKSKMQEEIKNVAKKTDCLSIIVTHDPEEAVYLGSKLIIMDSNPGRIKEILSVDLDNDSKDRNSLEFIKYKQHILDCLNK